MFISVDAGKTFNKIQHPITHDQILNKLGIRRSFLKLIKGAYKKLTANIILNGERMTAFSLRSGERQGYLILLLPFSIMLEVLARAVIQENKIKGIDTGDEEVKLSLFVHDMILYVEKFKKSTTKLLELTKEFDKMKFKKIN